MTDDNTATDNTWQYHRAPLGISEWEDFKKEAGTPHFAAYVEATGGVVQHLEELLAKASTFAELKAELTKFAEDRKEFVLYAHAHYPE